MSDAIAVVVRESEPIAVSLAPVAGYLFQVTDASMVVESPYGPVEVTGVQRLARRGTYAPSAPAPPPPWQPSGLPSLAAWWKADTVSVSPVPDWADSTGNGCTMATNPSIGTPTLSAGALNGLSVVHFDASDDDGLRATISNDPTYTVMHLSRITDGTPNRLVTACYPTPTNWLLGWHESGGAGSFYADGWVAEGAESMDDDWHQFTGGYDGGDSFFYDFGVLLADNDNGNATPQGTLNCNGFDPVGNEEMATGDIAEVLYFNVALDQSDRQKVEGYLAWKWGLEGDLPAGHPYKAAPPSGDA